MTKETMANPEDSSEAPEVCPVCMINPKLATLPCSHKMCVSCIVKWGNTKANVTCPVCRDPSSVAEDTGSSSRPRVSSAAENVGSSAQPTAPTATETGESEPSLMSQMLEVARIMSPDSFPSPQYDEYIERMATDLQFFPIVTSGPRCYKQFNTPINPMFWDGDEGSHTIPRLQLIHKSVSTYLDVLGLEGDDEEFRRATKLFFLDQFVIGGVVFYRRIHSISTGTLVVLRPCVGDIKSTYMLRVGRKRNEIVLYDLSYGADVNDWNINEEHEGWIHAVFIVSNFEQWFEHSFPLLKRLYGRS